MQEKYGSLMDSIIYMPKLWYKNEDIKGYVKEFEEAIKPYAYEILFNSEEASTLKIIPKIKNHNNTFLAIALWDELVARYTDEKALAEGPYEAWGWLISKGANTIMTDRPEELLDYLRRKKLHD